MLHRDRVKARIVRYDRKGRPEGRVLEILERTKAPIIGRLLHESGVWLVAPEDKRYGQDILIPKNAHRQRQGRAGGRDRADRAAVACTRSRSAASPKCSARSTTPAWRSRSRCASTRCRTCSRRGALAQAAALPDKVRPADRKGRIDLTDVPLVTIDGEDARDFDDAVYCEPARSAGRGAARAGACSSRSPTSATT